MRIYDCFMYFDEEIVLETRLNYLNKHVDYFVIVESCYTHKGDRRNLKFNINNFPEFKNKIIYKVYDEVPSKISKVLGEDDENTKSVKYIMNAIYRENAQRNYISEAIKDATEQDIILISDVDEIPNLENFNLNNITEKKIMFKQDMFYYKFNLKLPNTIWTGTKACKKKYLQSPQWLRNIKDKKFPFYRIDTIFSKTKYRDIEFVDNGGWHFTNIKTADEIEYKLKSYLHHREFDASPLTKNEISQIMRNKRAIYDLNADKKFKKFGDGAKLENYSIEKLPKYLQDNINNYQEWID